MDPQQHIADRRARSVLCVDFEIGQPIDLPDIRCGEDPQSIPSGYLQAVTRIIQGMKSDKAGADIVEPARTTAEQVTIPETENAGQGI